MSLTISPLASIKRTRVRGGESELFEKIFTFACGTLVRERRRRMVNKSGKSYQGPEKTSGETLIFARIFARNMFPKRKTMMASGARPGTDGFFRFWKKY